MRLDVIGIAAPQGSKTRMPNGAMVDGGSSATGRAKLVEWRRAVADAARAELAARPRPPFTGPTKIIISFRFPATKSNPWRFWHATVPDVSKILRSTEDALVHGGLLSDDRILCDTRITKRYVKDGELPGCTIDIETLADEEDRIQQSRKERARAERRSSRPPARRASA